MLGSHFYNEVTRKSIIAFGTLFNNISIKKKDPSTGAVLEESKVPLAYGPRQKFLVRLEQMVSATRKVSITVPRLYFEMNSIDYDPQRKTSPIQKYKTIINDSLIFLRWSSLSLRIIINTIHLKVETRNSNRDFAGSRLHLF